MNATTAEELYHQHFDPTEYNDGERDREHYETWVAGAQAAITHLSASTEGRERAVREALKFGAGFRSHHSVHGKEWADSMYAAYLATQQEGGKAK